MRKTFFRTRRKIVKAKVCQLLQAANRIPVRKGRDYTEILIFLPCIEKNSFIQGNKPMMNVSVSINIF